MLSIRIVLTIPAMPALNECLVREVFYNSRNTSAHTTAPPMTRQSPILMEIFICCCGPMITAGGYKARKKSANAPMPT